MILSTSFGVRSNGNDENREKSILILNENQHINGMTVDINETTRFNCNEIFNLVGTINVE